MYIDEIRIKVKKEQEIYGTKVIPYLEIEIREDDHIITKNTKCLYSELNDFESLYDIIMKEMNSEIKNFIIDKINYIE